MKQVKFICQTCQYEKTVDENHICEVTDCPICGSHLVYDNVTEQEEPLGDNFPETDKSIIVCLKRELNMLGNQRVYETIETITDVKTRIMYRKYFIAAGGSIPVTDIPL